MYFHGIWKNDEGDGQKTLHIENIIYIQTYIHFKKHQQTFLKNEESGNVKKIVYTLFILWFIC